MNPIQQEHAMENDNGDEFIIFNCQRFNNSVAKRRWPQSRAIGGLSSINQSNHKSSATARFFLPFVTRAWYEKFKKTPLTYSNEARSNA